MMLRPIFFATLTLAAACGSSEPAQTTSGGSTGVGGGGGGSTMFDPVAQISEAFSAAGAEAAKTYADHQVSFVEALATGTTTGASYASTAFEWRYTFAICDASQDPCGDPQGIEVVYPGWATRTIHEQPMGAYLAEGEIAGTIALDFTAMLKKAEEAGLSQSTCPIPGEGAQGYFLLHGTILASGTHWFWELGCAGSTDVHTFEVGSGS